MGDISIILTGVFSCIAIVCIAYFGMKIGNGPEKKEDKTQETKLNVQEMYDLRQKMLDAKSEDRFDIEKMKLTKLIKSHSPKDSSGEYVSIAFIEKGGDPYDGILLSDIEKMSFKNSEEDIHDIFIRANMHQNLGENNEACALYTHVLQEIFKNPKSIKEKDYYVCTPNDKGEANVIPISGVSFNLGKSYLELGHLNEAKQCFEKSIELNPDNWVHSHHYLGVLKIKQGDFTSCIVDFENALRIDSKNYESLYMLGLAYASDNCDVRDLEKASIYLNDYLSVNPKDESALSLLKEIKLKTTGVDSKVTKGEAIFMCKKQFKMNLSVQNTNWSSINSDDTWSVEPNLNRAKKDWHLILYNNKSNKIHLFKVPQNDTIYDRLYTREDKSVYRLVFDLDDKNFEEKLKNINFKKFYIGTINF